MNCFKFHFLTVYAAIYEGKFAESCRWLDFLQKASLFLKKKKTVQGVPGVKNKPMGWRNKSFVIRVAQPSGPLPECFPLDLNNLGLQKPDIKLKEPFEWKAKHLWTLMQTLLLKSHQATMVAQG